MIAAIKVIGSGLIISIIAFSIGAFTLHAYLRYFGVNAFDVATLTDFYFAAFYGITYSLTVLFVAVASYAFWSHGVRHKPVLAVAAYFLLLCLFVVVPMLIDYDVGLFAIAIVISYALILPYIVGLLVSFFVAGTPISELPLIMAASVISIYTTFHYSITGSVLAHAKYVGGFVSDYSQYSTTFTKETIEQLPDECRCGGIFIWNGERTSVILCAEITVMVKNPDNVVAVRQATQTPLGRGFLRDLGEVGVDAFNFSPKVDPCKSVAASRSCVSQLAVWAHIYSGRPNGDQCSPAMDDPTSRSWFQQYKQRDCGDNVISQSAAPPRR